MAEVSPQQADLYEATDAAERVRRDVGKGYPHAFLVQLQKDNDPLLQAFIESQEEGVLKQVDAELDKWERTVAQRELLAQKPVILAMIQENGLDSTNSKVEFNGNSVEITLPCPGKPLVIRSSVADKSQDEWALEGAAYIPGYAPYGTSWLINGDWGTLEEVLEDAKWISTALDRVVRGELTSESLDPFKIEKHILTFDGRDLHAPGQNTFETENPDRLAKRINERFRTLTGKNAVASPVVAPAVAEPVTESTATSDVVEGQGELTTADINKFASEQIPSLLDLEEGESWDSIHEKLRIVSKFGEPWLVRTPKFEIEISKKGELLQVRLSGLADLTPEENRLWDAYREAVVTELHEYKGVTSQVDPDGKHETIITVAEVLPFMSWDDFQKSEAFNPNQTPDKMPEEAGYVSPLKDGYTWVSGEDDDNYAFEKADEPTAAADPEQSPAIEAASEAPLDYRADARANPEKYLTESASDTSTFTPPNRKAEMAIRIEDLYDKNPEKPNLASTRYPGLTFAYGSGKDGNSWYDVAGTGKRLAILSGDRFTEMKEEPAPVVAVAEPVAPVAPVEAPVEPETTETVASMSQVELRAAALTLKNDREVLKTVLPQRRAEWEAKKGKLFANDAMIAEEIAKIDADMGRYARSVEVLTAQVSEQKNNPVYALVMNEVFDDPTRVALKLPEPTAPAA